MSVKRIGKSAAPMRRRLDSEHGLVFFAALLLGILGAISFLALVAVLLLGG